jgi:hypothetical protein
MIEEHLLISRDDVSYTEVQDFSFNDRFFKLPIDKFVSKITDLNGDPISLTSPQIALVNAIQNPKYRSIVAVFSRRVGKTFAANWIANILSLEPNKHILIISPNYSLSKISWEIQIDLFRRFEIKPLKKNEKDRVIVLENNSTIRMTSANQVDNAIGRSYDLILMDEAAIDNKLGTAFSTQLRPTLDKINSKVIFISTPRGSNYFKEFYERGFSDEYPEWVSLWCNYRANPRANPKDIEQARRSMSKAEFMQEYEASFSIVEGQIFEYDDDNIIDFDKDYRGKIDVEMVVGGIDTGFKDYTTMVVGYFTEDKVFIVDEYKKNKLTTDKHAENFHYISDVHDIDIIYIDGANAQFKEDLAQVYQLPTVLSKKDVLPSINYVQTLLENKKILIDKDCKELLDSMLVYRWDPNDNLIKPKPLHEGSDMCDAFRYLVYNAGPGLLTTYERDFKDEGVIN